MTLQKKWNFLLLAALVICTSACHDPEKTYKVDPNGGGGSGGNGNGNTVTIGLLIQNNCYDREDLEYLQEVVDTNGNPQSASNSPVLVFKTHFSDADRVNWAQDILDAVSTAPFCQKI